jgi:hypothetical protein
MKKAILILFLFTSSFLVLGQELNKSYYLLGSLEDYMGRPFTKNNPKNWGYIMTLHESRMGEIRRIEEVTGLNFKRRRKRKNSSNHHEFFELSSIYKANRINSFYNFEKNKGMKDLLGYSFFTGILIEDKIISAKKENQISFLAGQFLTCGGKTVQNYTISLYNSPNRFEIIIKLLENLNCKIIKIEKRETIPFGYFIEFNPTLEILEVLENEIKKENTLSKSLKH